MISRLPQCVAKCGLLLQLILLVLAPPQFTFLEFASAQVTLPQGDQTQPILVTAEAGNHWREGIYDVWLLRGNCRISQGAASATAMEAALWIDHGENPTRGHPHHRPGKIIAYLNGHVVVAPLGTARPTRLADETWLGRFFTNGNIAVRVTNSAGKPEAMPAIYGSARARWQPPLRPSGVVPVQFIEPLEELVDGDLPPDTRRLRIMPRSNVDVTAEVQPPDLTTNEWTVIINSGVNVLIDGLGDVEGLHVGGISIWADRVVIWTRGLENFNVNGPTIQRNDEPLDIYMEGNIEFRQGKRVIYANRMFYDARNNVGTVLQADVITPAPNFNGKIRLRAEMLQQLDRNTFVAHDTFVTSSLMGRPGYRFEAGEIAFTDLMSLQFDPVTGESVNDEFGEPMVAHHREATAQSRNNFLFIGEIPVFYWPVFATSLEDPTFYIRSVELGNNSVYGTQIRTGWDAYEIFGITNPPQGLGDWDLSLDYLGDRGLGHGTKLEYRPGELLPWPGFEAGVHNDAASFWGGRPVERAETGLLDFWGLRDTGEDNLGEGRRSLTPEEDYRYRLFWRHRQYLPNEFRVTAELGWISDRNYLEQFFEREWDTEKDQSTGIELKRTYDNIAWSVTGDARINDFVTQTEWLPRGDHFWLGQSLARDALTWYEHSSVGYARYRVTTAPTDPDDLAGWGLLPWENNGTGERLITRQEIDWPFQMGAVKLVPFALGELGHWGEALDGDALQRTYWEAGIRASLPMWWADPTWESQLFNVHGMAHKVVFDTELSIAEANRQVTELALYDPLDDDAVEDTRRRLPFIGPQFDSRSYAVRSGMGGWVTAPSSEVADDLVALRMGMHHRWQTKRGIPGQRRIVDWITLDTNATVFPKDERDNFGKTLGLVDYDFRWHVGDRLTLLSDGMFDFFDRGQKTVSLGGFLNRPPRGNIYAGLRLLDGPVSSHVFTLTYNYEMSPKWNLAFGTSYDFAKGENIGQRFVITRIGESLLFSAGFTVDSARDNVGVNFAIQPRFVSAGWLSRYGREGMPSVEQMR